MKVLIDGENLRHQLAHVLDYNQKITDHNAYFRFDLTGFISEVLHTENVDITYYTTRIKQPDQKIPVKLQNKITAISASKRRWVADLTNQNVTVVKAGYLRVRTSNACIHCGKKTLVLQEKGVDVRLATDMVITSSQATEKIIAVGSSDSDLIPAIAAVRRAGLQILYFCYAGWLNRSVAAQTDKTITFDDETVLKYFKGSK